MPRRDTDIFCAWSVVYLLDRRVSDVEQATRFVPAHVQNVAEPISHTEGDTGAKEPGLLAEIVRSYPTQSADISNWL